MIYFMWNKGRIQRWEPKPPTNCVHKDAKEYLIRKLIKYPMRESIDHDIRN